VTSSPRDGDGTGRRPLRHDPAAPHTAPHPSHVPRWLAWTVLAALAVSGAVCAGLMMGGGAR
jgi:hypothetical protein